MMNVLRSPNGGGMSSAHGGSQPNLSVNSDFDTPKITFRNKRKLSDSNGNVIQEILEMKKQMSEMMSLIASSTAAQTENINRLCQDVSTIKGQVDKICSSIDTITIEQDKMKADILNVVASSNVLGNKVERLEKEVEGLKSSCTQDFLSVKPISYNKIITECQERTQRAKNIIVIGIAEATSENDIERSDYDKEEISKITKLALADCPEPENMHRLGKYQQDKIRPIKVVFGSEDTVKLILRNRNNVAATNIKIYSDQTPYQRETLRALKQELEHRIADGEANIGIRYVKGEPTIVKALPKNSPIASNTTQEL